ncbi:MAG: hemerythrin domain-containing protein [Candidatus Thermoplasmatota archaeon]|nr:hemerythrin domain-containing protein [Candidatus Thermoplasmatota archaeon]
MDTEIDALRSEHSYLLEKINDLAQREAGSSKIFIELRKLSYLHIEREQETIIPLLRYLKYRLDGKNKKYSPDLNEIRNKMILGYGELIEDHINIMNLLEEAFHETYQVEVMEFVKNIAHHIALEEQIFYPAAMAAVDLIMIDAENNEKIA